MTTSSRRDFLINATRSVLALTAISQATASPLASSKLFAHGVASGDPTPERVVIWTRVSALLPARTLWQVALDKQFHQLIKSGEITASAERDYTVKVDVSGLQPNQTYFYRFICESQYSPVGRTRTLPVGQLGSLSFAVVSCSNYPFGYFNAYEHIAEDSKLDFVLHLGDYIYEYGQDGWGGTTGKLLNRQHQPAHEILSLSDYRIRHAQYKSDPASQLMHAAHPLIPIWDDHESANNPYMGGAKNHQNDEGDWFARRMASVKAYYEWMPVREPSVNADQLKFWRHFQFGDLASLITLETRHTGRSKQLSYDMALATITDKASRDAFFNQQIYDPTRTILHPDMSKFLTKKLADSVNKAQPWRLIANQIPMARINMPDYSDIVDIHDAQFSDKIKKRLRTNLSKGQWQLPLSMDTWAGYGAAREAFYAQCKSVNASDLLVFTGDSHCFWSNKLHTQQGQHMGFEIGTTSVTSPGSFEYLGTYTRDFEQALADQNVEVLWADCQYRGYVKATLSPTQANIEYIAMKTITKRSTESFVQKRLRIDRQENKLVLNI